MANAEKDGKITAESNQGALTDGLMKIFRPAVEELDNKVISVRYHDTAVLSGNDKIMFQCAPINGLPQEWGVGQPRGNLTFSGFKYQFPHPWVSIVSQIHPPGDHILYFL